MIAGRWRNLTKWYAKVRRLMRLTSFTTSITRSTTSATVTLSARYFDIIKDRLYTFAPRNKARRSAQTALLQSPMRSRECLAPILVFTADEIWENLPNRTEPSIHLALFPKAADQKVTTELVGEWERLFAIRDDVLRALEEARVAKQIGSSLEAKVTLQASGSALELLQKHQKICVILFIVSQVELGNADGRRRFDCDLTADGEKCERCWNYSTRVGESERYPTVCERCVAALKEIEQGINTKPSAERRVN
jgi:isoleucyl-tRNA synthetase